MGTGSGYGAAVLAELAREVVSIERIPSSRTQARKNLAAAGYERVQVLVGDATLGVQRPGAFDAIAVAAAAPSLPEALYEQLVRAAAWPCRSATTPASCSSLVVRSPRGRPCCARHPCASCR